MASSDGALTMVYNGEVYNFAAVRAELEQLGHRFRSSATRGHPRRLPAMGRGRGGPLIGMFAIAIWNERERRLVLLRDRMA